MVSDTLLAQDRKSLLVKSRCEKKRMQGQPCMSPNCMLPSNAAIDPLYIYMYPLLTIGTSLLQHTGPFSMHTPFNVLDTPIKRWWMRQHTHRAKALRMWVHRVMARMEKLQQESTVATEDDLSNDLIAIMADGDKDVQKLPETSFQRMFWAQQVHTT